MSSRPTSPNSGFRAPISEEIWTAKYRFQGGAEGKGADGAPGDTFKRVALAAASVEKGAKRDRDIWASTFQGAMSDYGFLPAGRILAGAGTGRAVTLFNCFVMGRIDDDLGAIFSHVKEAALTLQGGGGIGHDFSTLRPRGALVKSLNAEASGPVSFMDVWDAMCRTIMSAGARRGAMMATLRCDHPDIEEFIGAKADPARLRNFNLSVLVTDAFMAAVLDGRRWDLQFEGKVYRTIDARALWDRIMQGAYDYAEPGVIFIDRINALNNLNYCEQIATTNPCVTADTWVQTQGGPQQVSDLVGQPFHARVDGKDWSAPNGFFATGVKPVLRLTTACGRVVRLTPNHKILTVPKLTRFRRETSWREAQSLAPGDQVVVSNHRRNASWAGEGTLNEGYLLGLLIGDGTLKQDAAVLSVWKPRLEVNGPAGCGIDGIMRHAEDAARELPHRSDFDGWYEVGGRSEWRLKLASVKALATRYGMKPGDKSIKPIAERTSSEFHRGFLRGFFDADGSVQGDQSKGVSVRLAQSDLPRLEAVQRMLLRLGISSSLYKFRRPARKDFLPDGHGGTKQYTLQPQHDLVVSKDNLKIFSDQVGFSDTSKQQHLDRALANYERQPNREFFCGTIASIEPDGEAEVFDVSVPGCNAFDANGLVVHNCGEQPLPPYGACLLGSINLAELVERPFTAGATISTVKLEARVAAAVRLLDNVIDVSRYPLPAQHDEAKNKRRIGLGVTGLADALIFSGLKYGTKDAVAQAQQWMKTIQRAAYLASVELAREKGVFLLCDPEKLAASPNVAALGKDVQDAVRRHGLRNGCLTSIAPTGTISLFAGNVSSGIEPVFDFVYSRKVRAADGSFVSETVEDYAHAKFRQMFGPDKALPETFVRASDLSPAQHLAMQAAMQPYVDSAISKTVNCPEQLPFAEFKTLYSRAFELGLKGCTAYRPNPVTGAILTAGPVTAPGLASAPGPATEPLKEKQPQKTAAVAPNAVASNSSNASVSTAHASADVVYMTKPLERDTILEGATYKLKWASSDHALYITINDMAYEVPGANGPVTRRRPFEIFINSRNLEHYAWTVALTRMISAVFRRGGDVSFVADELKAIFDPQGGAWMDGQYVPSLLAAIGNVIETHMVRSGFMSAPNTESTRQPMPSALMDAAANYGNSVTGHPPAADRTPLETKPASPRRARSCPRCGNSAYRLEGGCWTCQSCGFSRCE